MNVFNRLHPIDSFKKVKLDSFWPFCHVSLQPVRNQTWFCSWGCLTEVDKQTRAKTRVRKYLCTKFEDLSQKTGERRVSGQQRAQPGSDGHAEDVRSTRPGRGCEGPHDALLAPGGVIQEVRQSKVRVHLQVPPPGGALALPTASAQPMRRPEQASLTRTQTPGGSHCQASAATHRSRKPCGSGGFRQVAPSSTRVWER